MNKPMLFVHGVIAPLCAACAIAEAVSGRFDWAFLHAVLAAGNVLFFFIEWRDG